VSLQTRALPHWPEFLTRATLGSDKSAGWLEMVRELPMLDDAVSLCSGVIHGIDRGEDLP
jgi:hypothetical protein